MNRYRIKIFLIWTVLMAGLCTRGISGTPTLHRTVLLEMKLGQKEYAALQAMKIEFATGLVDSTALAVVTQPEMAVLRERGYSFRQLLRSHNERTLYKRALYGEAMVLDSIYHDYDEILTELHQLRKQYPELIRLKKIGRTSQEKRDIWAVKISDRVMKEEDEPSILFSGAIHSDELAGPEICLALIHHLLENYATDRQVADWVNNYEIWFIPVINVDGHYVVTQNIDPRWRKNTRDNNGNGVLYEPDDGIDLNRNFDFNWAHGGSGDSASSRYRGEYPFSEGAARAVRDLAVAQRFVMSLTYHSQGEVIYFPWIWRGRPAPEDNLLKTLANGLAGSIRTMAGDTTYKAEYGAGTVGQTYPWFYGTQGTIDMIVETGLGRHIFPEAELEQIVAANVPGAFYMLNRLAGPGLTGHIRDARTGTPLKAEIWLPDIDTEDIHPRASEPRYGRYYRILSPGTYRVIVRCKGYQPAIFKQVKVNDGKWTVLDVSLEREK